MGDIVLIKKPMTKASNYSKAVVKDIVTNDMNEVTGAVVMKGKTRELLKRHSSTLIPLLSKNEMYNLEVDEKNLPDPDSTNVWYKERPKRKAARESEIKTRNILCNE